MINNIFQIKNLTLKIRAKRAGFSLIEVLLSGAIFAIVAIVGSTSLTNVLKTRAYNIKNSAVNNSLRSASEVILREVRDAHYIGNSNGNILLYDKNKQYKKKIADSQFFPYDPVL